MSDIVAKLRASNTNGAMCDEAADEIERLRAYTASLETSLRSWLDKTEWVQEQKIGLPGQHRMDIINELIATLRNGRRICECGWPRPIACEHCGKSYVPDQTETA